MSEDDTEKEKKTVPKNGMLVKKMCRRYDPAVLASIIALAVLLGVLNNLRVADERKVKWFEAPAVQTGLNVSEGAAQ